MSARRDSPVRHGSTARPHRIGYWAAVTAIVALPLAAIGLSVVNVLQASELDALAQSQEATVARLERRAQAAGSGAPMADASAIYVPGATPALAKAALQRRLIDAVEAVGGRVIEAQDADVELDRPEGGDDRVRLRLTFDATNAALLDLLHGVETGLPLLTVARLEIRRLDAAADADPLDPTLRVGVVVHGATRRAPG